MRTPKITINLTEAERAELTAQIRQQKSRKMADRIRIILYRGSGKSYREIAELLQIGRNQVTKWLQRYRDGGLSTLLEPDKNQGGQPKLTHEQQQSLKAELRTTIYVTAHQVIAWVEAQWGVSYELSGMQKLLKRLGFTYKKNRLVPSKADPVQQELFVRWFAGLRQHMGAEDRLYFCDAAHFKHNAEAGYAWSPTGQPHLIPSNSGRQRYNVVGAYCTQTHEYLFLLTEENVNQYTLVSFLPMLRIKHPTAAAIYLVLDNASYNHAHSVRDEAQRQRIRLEYLPPYSPNLNPIERLWKFVRKRFFKDKYRDSFDKFCTQLLDFFAHLDAYADELSSLLTENFERLPALWHATAAP